MRRSLLAALLPLCIAMPLRAQSPVDDLAEPARASAALQRLEGELAQLRASVARTRAEADALRALLDAPPAGLQVPLPVLQGLLVLLLAAVAGGGFMWWRVARRAPQADWQVDPMDSHPGSRPMPQAATVAAPVTAAPPVQAKGQWVLPRGFVTESARIAPVELAPLEFHLDLDLDVPAPPRREPPRR